MKRAALYLRVSGDEQSVENQRPELEQLVSSRGARISHVYNETGSAAKARAHFDRMMRDAHKGAFDMLAIWALDRFGRSMLGNLQAVLELDRLGVQVVSAREAWLDTASPVRSLLIAIFSWIAEQERTRIVERTVAGLERSKRKGVKLGRPHARIDLHEVDMLRDQGLTFEEVARRIGVGASTLHRARQVKG